MHPNVASIFTGKLPLGSAPEGGKYMAGPVHRSRIEEASGFAALA